MSDGPTVAVTTKETSWARRSLTTPLQLSAWAAAFRARPTVPRPFGICSPEAGTRSWKFRAIAGTSIAIDADSGAVYATYGNFGGAHIFRSVDNGETWQSLDGSGPTGLPDIPVHSIVVDPDDRQRLYLGTDLGVMVSIDGGQTWLTEETGFGPAVTMWLSLIRTPAGQKHLFAFTHGRGAWRVTLR